jgi:hypothetical protein
VSEVIAQVGPILLSSLLFATFDKVALLLPSAEEAPREALAVIEDAPATKEKKEEAEEIESAAGKKKKVEAKVSVVLLIQTLAMRCWRCNNEVSAM